MSGREVHDAAATVSSLHALLSLIERFGTVTLPARNVERLATVDARVALHAAGVLVTAPPAATWACELRRGCSREVRANYDGARKPLVAVCSEAPAACAPVELGFDDVAHQEVLVDALVRAACGLLGAVVEPAALAKVRERHPLGDARAPILIGTTGDVARDVFWAGSPRDTDLGGFCARRERVTRGTLVLVPTAAHVPPDVSARFAPGEHVEVRALADAIEVRDSALALGRSRPTAETRSTAPPAPETSAPHGLAALLGVTAWEEVRLSVADGHTIRIEAGGKAILRTFVELGFVDTRATEVVTPVTTWGLLLIFCKKGYLQPSEYGQLGKAYGANKAVERLGKVLRRSFGLEEHPIRKYFKRTGRWVARFRTAAVTEDESGNVSAPRRTRN